MNMSTGCVERMSIFTFCITDGIPLCLWVSQSPKCDCGILTGDLGVPHRSMADDEYRGFTIPEGTTVMANAW